MYRKLKLVKMKILKFLIPVAMVAALMSCKKDKEETPDPPDPTNNPWDGRYRIEGSMTDMKDPAFVWAGNTYEYRLETNSATQVTLYSKDLNFPGHLIRNGINLSYYGNFGLVVNFDPVTNKISSITNHYGQPSATNGRSAILDPSGANKWDPVTKNITIKYWMDETGWVGHRTSFDETWVYIGPR